MKTRTLIITVLIGIAAVIGWQIVANYTSSSRQPQPSSNTPQPPSSEVKLSGYTGKILAGTSSPYIEFNQADYQMALKDGKIIFLDFYANWCPICRGEAPEIYAGFNALQTDQIVGFRINYNDSDTDADEKKLAEQFEIPYQHTKVILKDGKQVLTDGTAWNSEKFSTQIMSILE